MFGGVIASSNSNISVPVQSETNVLIGYTLQVFNEYATLEFESGAYSDNGPLTTSNFSIAFTQGVGTATNVTIGSAENQNGDPLFGGERFVRLNLAITGTPNGNEQIEISTVSVDDMDDTDTGAFNLFMTYNAAYKAVLEQDIAEGNYMPDYMFRILENNLVQSLQDQGVWDISDVIYPFSIYGGAGHARLNWKAPSSFKLLPQLTYPFVTGVGFTPGAGYLRTGWVPTVDAVNYTLNNAAIIYAALNNVQDLTGYAYAVRHTDSNAGKRILLRPRNTSDAAQISLNSAVATTTGAITNSTFVSHQNRIGSGAVDHDYYVAGVLLDGTNGISVDLPNQEMVIGSEKVANGTVSNAYSLHRPGLFIAGASMAALAAAINTIWTNYQTALSTADPNQDLAINNAELITTDDGEQLQN